jgi:ribonuclease J
MEELRIIAAHSLDNCMCRGIRDWGAMKAAMKNDLSNYLYRNTKRSPMILPVIMEV